MDSSVSTGLVLIAAIIALCFLVLAYSGRRTSCETIALMILIALCSLNPAIIGEHFGPIGAVLLLGVAALAVRRGDFDLTSTPGLQWFALLGVIAWTLVVTQQPSVAALSGAVVAPVVAATGWVAGKQPRILERFTILTVALSAHQVLGLMISKVLGLESYSFAGSAMGRLGWTYSVSPLGSISVGSGGVARLFDERLTGPFGEPGILASFLAVIAMIDATRHQRWRYWVQIPLVAAILLTQSVAGFAVYGIGLAVFVVTTIVRRTSQTSWIAYVIVAVGILGFVWAVLIRSDDVLGVKLAANPESVDFRLRGTRPHEMLASWTESPFGTGTTEAGDGVNLLRSSITYGPLYLFFVLWLYAAPLLGRSAIAVLAPVAALSISILFAQPPMLYLWVFLAFLISGSGSQYSSTTGPDVRARSASYGPVVRS